MVCTLTSHPNSSSGIKNTLFILTVLKESLWGKHILKNVLSKFDSYLPRRFGCSCVQTELWISWGPQNQLRFILWEAWTSTTKTCPLWHSVMDQITDQRKFWLGAILWRQWLHIIKFITIRANSWDKNSGWSDRCHQKQENFLQYIIQTSP